MTKPLLICSICQRKTTGHGFGKEILCFRHKEEYIPGFKIDWDLIIQKKKNDDRTRAFNRKRGVLYVTSTGKEYK